MGNDPEEFRFKLSNITRNIFKGFQRVLSLICPSSNDNNILGQMILPVQDALMQAPVEGSEDERLIDILLKLNEGSLSHMITSNLLVNIREKLKSIVVLGCQTSFIIQTIDEQRISHASSLQMLGVTKRMLTAVESLLNVVATYLQIRENLSQTTRIITRSFSNQTQENTEPLYSYKSSENESPELGSFNHLISILISP